jgi:signal transduction histidine kinase
MGAWRRRWRSASGTPASVGSPRTQDELDLHGLSVELFAHDLRSPLMASRQAVLDLLQGSRALTDVSAELGAAAGRERHDRDELLTALGRSLERIDHLMVDILELASLPVTNMPRQRFGVRDLVDTLSQECSGQHRVTVRSSPRLVVIGNRTLLKRALLNLVENALRHTSGHVLVEACRAADGLMITVDDHGPGVPPELRDVIFEPLTRLEPESGVGSGLGLTLVRRVMEAHGGMTGVETAPTGGARFVLWVPHAHMMGSESSPRELVTAGGSQRA